MLHHRLALDSVCRVGLAVTALLLAACAGTPSVPTVLFTSAEGLAADDAAELVATGVRGVVLRVAAADDPLTVAEAAAALKAAGAQVGYWVDVGRAPELAARHPERVAVIGLDADELVRALPWVPILTREGYELQQVRVAALLAELPPARVVYLAGLGWAPGAGADAACRCADAELVAATGTPRGPSAGAEFRAGIAAAVPRSLVVSVVVAGCDDDTACAFRTARLEAFAAAGERLALYVPSRTIDVERDAADVAAAIEAAEEQLDGLLMTLVVDESALVPAGRGGFVISTAFEQGCTPRRERR